jgi:hypothetical protein
MPSRFVSLAILIYWSIAAFFLLSWDVIPELSQGYAPDLRAITVAGDSSRPVRWSVQTMDDPRHPDVRRTVGESVTATMRNADGTALLTSHVDLDAGALLRGTPFSSRSNERLTVDSRYFVDGSGNLNSFEVDVVSKLTADSLFKATGQLKGRKMEIVTKGPVEILNQNLSFDYEPRSVVQDVLGPLDRLPGLHVGQKWDSKVINPFTKQVDTVRVEVTRRALINWEGNPVTTFEVVHRTSPFAMKTWVRTDGVILRQEIPFPFVKLLLERRADSDADLVAPVLPKPEASRPASVPSATGASSPAPFPSKPGTTAK